MKFKKDSKVYESFRDAVDAFFLGDCRIFTNGEKTGVKFPDAVRQSMIWAYENADMGRVRLNAKLMGYEVIEDDSPDTREVVEQHGEGVKPKRRTLGASNSMDKMAEYVEKYLEGVKTDPVNRPAHYASGGIECIDAMQAAFGDEAVKDFCLCNAFKYLWRHRNKGGLQDLKKTRWYINRLIREMEVEE